MISSGGGVAPAIRDRSATSGCSTTVAGTAASSLSRHLLADPRGIAREATVRLRPRMPPYRRCGPSAEDSHTARWESPTWLPAQLSRRKDPEAPLLKSVDSPGAHCTSWFSRYQNASHKGVDLTSTRSPVRPKCTLGASTAVQLADRRESWRSSLPRPRRVTRTVLSEVEGSRLGQDGSDDAPSNAQSLKRQIASERRHTRHLASAPAVRDLHCGGASRHRRSASEPRSDGAAAGRRPSHLRRATRRDRGTDAVVTGL